VGFVAGFTQKNKSWLCVRKNFGRREQERRYNFSLLDKWLELGKV